MQLRRRWRRWPLLVGVLGGYIAWDVVDQTVLLPRGLSHSFGIDWAVVGVVGVTAWLVLEYRERAEQRASAEVAVDPALTATVLFQLQDALIALDDTLRNASTSLTTAIATTEIEQLRQLRHTMVALHQAQSLSDELNGLVTCSALPAPPSPEELYERPVVSAHQ